MGGRYTGDWAHPMSVDSVGRGAASHDLVSSLGTVHCTVTPHDSQRLETLQCYVT